MSKKTLVFEYKMLPLSEIKGRMCAWDGCDEVISGDLPKGWVNLLVYWSPQPKEKFLSIPAKNVYRDAVLCPAHADNFEQQLKFIPRWADKPTKGEA
jgi:hypothetical protein